VRDAALWLTLVVAFATFLIAHLFIAVRLCLHRPRYRGLVALVVLPLAPRWAYTHRWLRAFWIWLGAAALYGVALTIAQL
jgi:hypothetical protein